MRYVCDHLFERHFLAFNFMGDYRLNKVLRNIVRDLAKKSTTAANFILLFTECKRCENDAEPGKPMAKGFLKFRLQLWREDIPMRFVSKLYTESR